jgi:hypothetical protein
MVMPRLVKWLVGLAALGLAFVLASEAIMARVAEPSYDTIEADGRTTVRRYAPMILATVSVTGERRPAVNEGFRILADYIFGNNDGGAKIAMTAPVLQQPEGERIAMTAPVTAAPAAAGAWEVSFVMPAEYTIDTLPKPRDPRVRILEVPARTVAAVTFSGLPNAAPLDRHAAELAEWIAARGMRPVGPPRFAFYDPPWTLPFLRRNEVMVEVDR